MDTAAAAARLPTAAEEEGRPSAAAEDQAAVLRILARQELRIAAAAAEAACLLRNPGRRVGPTALLQQEEEPDRRIGQQREERRSRAFLRTLPEAAAERRTQEPVRTPVAVEVLRSLLPRKDQDQEEVLRIRVLRIQELREAGPKREAGRQTVVLLKNEGTSQNEQVCKLLPTRRHAAAISVSRGTTVHVATVPLSQRGKVAS